MTGKYRDGNSLKNKYNLRLTSFVLLKLDNIGPKVQNIMKRGLFGKLSGLIIIYRKSR